MDSPHSGFATIGGKTKMTFKPVVVICASVFFLTVSCAGTANRVMPGYSRMDVSAATCGVILMKNTLQILNADDIMRELGNGMPEEVYYNFFGSEFPAAMKKYSHFPHVYFLPGADQRILQSAGSAPNNSGERASLPSRRGFISDSLNYLFIMDNLSIKHEQKSNLGISGGSDGNFAGFSGGSENMTHSATFVLWDNKEGTIAAYGNIQETVAVFDTVKKMLLEDMLNDMAHSAVKGMPYGR
jgi:hypothetical protein